MSSSIDQSEQFALASVAFFGRTLNEYKQMLDLDIESMKGKKVLDCPSGPASFVSESNKLGILATGCDPQYAGNAGDLVKHAQSTIETCMQKVKTLAHRFDWESEAEREAFKNEKLTASKRFGDDFEAGLAAKRYLNARLPNLPFADKSFDMAFSTYLLFLYADTAHGGILESSPFDYDFHLKSILELVRVTREEIRIYPLKGPNSESHPFVPKIIADLGDRNIKTAVTPSSYKDIRGANEMLRIYLA